MMKKGFLLLILCLNTFFVFSQIDRYVVEFSSFGDYPLKGKTFYIVSGNSSISDFDQEFLYYSDIIKQCLIRQKAIPTTDKDNADFCVLLDYGIKDQSYVATDCIPIFGKTGISSVTTTSQTTGYISGSSRTYGSASISSFGNSLSIDGGSVSRGSASGSSITTTTQDYNYDYGVTGYQNVSYKVDEYRRVINLYAYDNLHREGQPIMLWKDNAVSDGSSNDLATVFPYMANIMLEGMGKASNGIKRYSIYSNNPDVFYMKHKTYLKDSIFVNPNNYGESGCYKLFMRYINIRPQNTIVNIMAFKSEKLSYLRFQYTFIKYQNHSYPVDNVTLQMSTDASNYVGRNIYLEENMPTCCLLRFPINLNIGDTIDIVSYKDKKLKNKVFHFHDVIIK